MGNCKRCGQHIVWKQRGTKWVPVEPAMSGGSQYDPYRHVDHRRVCPADQPDPASVPHGPEEPFREVWECPGCGAALWVKLHWPENPEGFLELETMTAEWWERTHRECRRRTP